MSNLYQLDFNTWTDQTAQLLREGRWAEIDIEHLIEEIEDLGKRDQKPLLVNSFAFFSICSSGSITRTTFR